MNSFFTITVLSFFLAICPSATDGHAQESEKVSKIRVIASVAQQTDEEKTDGDADLKKKYEEMIADLLRKNENAISDNEFEQAAIFRDKRKVLEKGLKKIGKDGFKTSPADYLKENYDIDKTKKRAKAVADKVMKEQAKRKEITSNKDKEKAMARLRAERADKMRTKIVERSKAQLKKSGIDATFEGISYYFAAFEPSDSTKERARALISELDSPSYRDREIAVKELFAMPVAPMEMLKKATESSVPEIAWRAEELLVNIENTNRENLIAALKLVGAAKIKGLTPQIFQVLGLVNDPRKYEVAAIDAVRHSTTEKDWKFLVEKADSENATTQRIALIALRYNFDQRIKPEFEKLLKKSDLPELSRLEIAYGFANLDDKSSLDQLYGLLSSEELSIRVRANKALSGLTNANLKVSVYGKPEVRKKQVEKWKTWLAKNRESTELRIPLENSLRLKSYLNGNTLVSHGYKNKIVELGPDNKVVWEYTNANLGAWSAEKLENGNILIAAYRMNKVIEVSMDKKIVWEKPASGVLNARPLENGNVLLALYSSNKVQEMDRDGEIVWEYKGGSSVADAIRMENGNTLVAESNRVVEVTPDKDVVWEYKTNSTYGINLTESGTLLISELSSKVVELRREDKEVIWEYKTANPVDAFRLENGNTLITNASQVIEVTPDEDIVWKRDNVNYGTARR